MMLLRYFTILLAACTFSGCEFLQQASQVVEQSQVQAVLPTVAYQDATLVQSPSQHQLSAYYCPIVVPDVLIPGSAALACNVAFGAPPAPSQMTVAFELRFLVKNPNHFPIPLAEVLTAALVFPDKTAQSLGAACVSFCGADQPGCTGAPGPDSCRAKSTDIKTLDDFKNAAANLLIVTGLTMIAGEKPSFLMPQVVADSEIIVKLRFSFGPDALLGVLQQVASQSYEQLKSGQDIVFSIPYRLQGTAWFDVGSLGRVALGWGPADGVWVLPTTALLP